MGKTTGFLEYPRVEPGQRPPAERINDWNEIRLPQYAEEMSRQGARCMNCGVPFCQGGIILNGAASGCPLHNLIPEWNAMVYAGRWDEAWPAPILFPNSPPGRVPPPAKGLARLGPIGSRWL